MPDYYRGTELAKPPPPHTLTDAAQAARASFAAWSLEHPVTLGPNGKTRREGVEAGTSSLVTQHVPPWQRGEVADLIGAPALFAKAALAAGREVAVKTAGAAVCVGVRGAACNADGNVKCDGNCRPRVRAYWVAGRTAGVLLDGAKVTLATAKAAL